MSGPPENAGVENAGVETAGVIKYGKPSNQKTVGTKLSRMVCERRELVYTSRQCMDSRFEQLKVKVNGIIAVSN